MEVFDFSWRIEKQAEFAYRALEKNALSKLMKHLFSSLASVEMLHYEMIQRVGKGEKIRKPDASLFPSAREALADLTLSRKALKGAVSQIEVYKAVRDSEEASERFYREKAKEAADAGHREFFRALAEEEQEHYILLDLMIGLIGSARASEKTTAFGTTSGELGINPE